MEHLLIIINFFTHDNDHNKYRQKNKNANNQ